MQKHKKRQRKLKNRTISAKGIPINTTGKKKMSTLQQEIYKYVGDHKYCTMTDLSRDLGLTTGNTPHIIDTMIRGKKLRKVLVLY